MNLARIKLYPSNPGKATAPHFFLDSPQVRPGEPHGASSPLVVSGWVIPPEGRAVRAVDVLIDGRLVARTSGRGPRPDVARVFRGRLGAMRSGFSTEVNLDRWLDRDAEMSLVVDCGAAPYVLTRIPLTVERRVGEEPRRERSFELDGLLACPDCLAGAMELMPDRVRCDGCGAVYESMRGTPMFLTPGSPILSRLLETHFTHPYCEESLEIIDRYKDGVVLDFGAGHPHPDRLHPNVLLHEAVHYNQIDVVSVTSRLPYRDNSFDAIISQAVFEHVPRPWEVAAELHRVLKPGGRIHIDTAFMQPFHSDPNHFFNMTLSGLREIFRPFHEARAGVKPYQLPSYGLRMQLGVMLEHLASGKWRNRMRTLLGQLERDGSALDTALDRDGQNNLAAGVYFDGTK